MFSYVSLKTNTLLWYINLKLAVVGVCHDTGGNNTKGAGEGGGEWGERGDGMGHEGCRSITVVLSVSE